MDTQAVQGFGTAGETLKSGHGLAFLFPGVGSEYSGMGRYVFDNFPCARAVFEQASAAAERDIAKLCFDADEADRLGDLANAKLAVVTASVAASRVVIEDFGIEPDYCAGHSVGEYSALCCAGVLGLDDAVKLLQARAGLIEALLSSAAGTMAWAINLPSEKVEAIAATLQEQGHRVYLSAFDCPDQTSLSCSKESFAATAAAVEEAGGILVPINAPGPFHCPLMQVASERYREVLAQCEFGKADFPVLANYDARPYPETREAIIENLALHIVRPVQWRATVAHLQEKRVRRAIELGAKNILSFLLRKTTEEISAISLDKEENWVSFQADMHFDDEGVLEGVAACLGVIASTRNGCRDPEAYQARVVAPLNALKELHGALKSGERPISRRHLMETIEATANILMVKKVPPPEIAKRLAKALGPDFVDLHFR